MSSDRWEIAITDTKNLLLRSAERICSASFSEATPLRMPEDVRGWDGRTWTRRCRFVDPAPGVPGSVILKQFRLGGGHGMAEWTGYASATLIGVGRTAMETVEGDYWEKGRSGGRSAAARMRRITASCSS